MAGETQDARVVLEAVDHFTKTFKAFIGNMNDAASAAKNTTLALQAMDAGPALAKVAAGSQGIATAQEKVAKASTAAKTTFNTAQNQMRDASGKFVAGATSDMNKHKGATSGWASVVTGLYEKVGHSMIDIALKVSQATARAIGDSISVAANFESSMNKFEAAGGDAVEAVGLKMADFTKLAIDMGKKWPVSTTEVADMMTVLVKSGMDPAIIKAGALESGIQFAAAANMDLTSAADLSVKMLATFGDANASAAEKTKFLADTQNLLVKADGAATSSVEKIGEAVLAAGGTAKVAGVETKDYITTMAMMTDQFPSAAEAGTSYKNMLLSLLPKTKEQIKVAGKLGLLTKEGTSVFYDSTGAFVGNRKSAELLHGAFSGLTQEQASFYARTLFGNDAMNAAMVMATGGAAAYDRYASAMATAKGVQAQAATNMKGANTAMENFKGSIEAAQISVVGNLLPALTAVLNQGLSPLVNGIEAFVTKGGGVEAFAASAEKSVANVISVFKNFFGILSGGGISYIHGLQFALETFMPKDIAAKVAGFVGTVVSGIQGVVAWVTANWPTISAIIGAGLTFLGQMVTTYVVPFVTGLIAGIGQVIAWVSANWPMILAAIGTVLSMVGGLADQYVMPFVTSLISIIGQLVSFIAGNLPQIASVAGSVFGTIAGFITTMIIPNVLFVITIFQKLVNWVAENLPLLIAVQQKWSQDLQNNLRAIAPVLQILGTLFQVAFDVIKTVIMTFVDVVLALFKAGMQLFLGDTSGALETMRQLFQDKFNAVLNWLRGLVPQFLTMGAQIIDGLINGLKSAGDRLKGFLVGLIKSAVGKFAEFIDLGSPSRLFHYFGEMTMQGYADGLWSMRDQVADAMRGVVGNAIDGATAMMGDMASLALDGGGVGASLGDMAAGGFGNGTGATDSAFGGSSSTQQININVDGQRIARAVVSSGAPAVQSNRRRLYGGGGGGRGISRNQ